MVTISGSRFFSQLCQVYSLIDLLLLTPIWKLIVVLIAVQMEDWWWIQRINPLKWPWRRVAMSMCSLTHLLKQTLIRSSISFFLKIATSNMAMRFKNQLSASILVSWLMRTMILYLWRWKHNERCFDEKRWNNGPFLIVQGNPPIDGSNEKP